MAEQLLNVDHVHAVLMKLGGAEAPQHVRGQDVGPFRQMSGSGPGERGPERLVADAGDDPSVSLALRQQQRHSGVLLLGALAPGDSTPHRRRSYMEIR
ncbi:hypothetical protein [Nonomuraea diastatica]|uniref:hypothetical protein n=1 Tax=Nonomuraea diastatica TaxID=1848329 RepID=UPI001408B973|nr:hypothetical protein [Nonomuraea diastatica]